MLLNFLKKTQIKKWNLLRTYNYIQMKLNNFRKQLGKKGKLCEECKKMKATALINRKYVCRACFNKLKGRKKPYRV